MADFGDARLLLNFDDDDRSELTHRVDLSPMLAQGGVFEPLREPAIFERVQIGPHGRTLVWKVGVNEDDIVLIRLSFLFCSGNSL